MLLLDGKIFQIFFPLFLFNIIFVIVFNRPNIDKIEVKGRERENVALNYIIDITAAIKYMERGQTIIYKYENLPCLFVHSAYFVHCCRVYQHVLSRWTILYRNGKSFIAITQFIVDEHTMPHHHHYYADNLMLFGTWQFTEKS